jgi:hypothetical protein
MVSGAFAILATLLGLAALALARTGLRQIRRAVPPGGATGRGLAMAGLICGAVGVFLTLASFVASLALTATR